MVTKSGPKKTAFTPEMQISTINLKAANARIHSFPLIKVKVYNTLILKPNIQAKEITVEHIMMPCIAFCSSQLKYGLFVCPKSLLSEKMALD